MTLLVRQATERAPAWRQQRRPLQEHGIQNIVPTRAVGRTSDAWSVKSKAALLLALVVKRQGHQLLQALQPQLLLLSQQGPMPAEMVSPVRMQLTPTMAHWVLSSCAGPLYKWFCAYTGTVAVHVIQLSSPPV